MSSSLCVCLTQDMAGDDEDITFCSPNCFRQFNLTHQTMATDDAKVRAVSH